MNWINVFELGIVILMLAPNMLYAYQNKNMKNRCTNKLMNGIEQVGRYGSMLLMVCPIGIAEFAFRSENGFAIWLVAIAVLLALYWLFWIVYLRRPSRRVALLLAILPSAIFIVSGVMQQHWLLVAFGVLFSVGHVYVTAENNL